MMTNLERAQVMDYNRKIRARKAAAKKARSRKLRSRVTSIIAVAFVIWMALSYFEILYANSGAISNGYKYNHYNYLVTLDRVLGLDLMGSTPHN